VRAARRKVTARPAADTEGVKDGAGDVEVPQLRGALGPNMAFCPSCGTKFSQPTPAAPPAPPQPGYPQQPYPRYPPQYAPYQQPQRSGPSLGGSITQGFGWGCGCLLVIVAIFLILVISAPLAGASTYAPSKQNVAGSRPVSRSTPCCICVGIRRRSGNGASPNLAHPGLASCAGKRQDQAAWRLRFDARRAVMAVRASPASRRASAPANRTGNHGPGSFGQANGPP